MARKLFRSHRPRSAVAAVAGIGLMLTAAACGGGGAGDDPSPGGTADGPPEAGGSITVWFGSWYEDQVPKIEEKWKQDHPEITLNIETLPVNGYLDKFTASALAGAPPDLIDVDTTWVSSLADQGILQTWDGDISEADAADFVKADWDASSFEGHLYAVPNRADASVYYYNETVFDDAGVPYPEAGWTMDDLKETVLDLTVPGERYGIGLGADVTNPSEVTLSFMPTLWAHGGDLLSSDNSECVIDQPAGVSALSFWTSFYTEYGAAPEGTPNFTIVRDVAPMFMADQVGLISGYSNTVAQLSEDPDVRWGSVLPPGDVSYSLGWSFALPVGAPNADAARVFALWFTETETLAELAIRIPARYSSLEIAPWSEPQYEVFRDALKIARAAPSVAHWTEMQVILITELQKILTGNSTPEGAAEAICSQIDAVIAGE